MVGLDPLVLLPYVLLGVVPPDDNMFGPLGSNLGCPLVALCGLLPRLALFISVV